jgi:hypothetical protein
VERFTRLAVRGTEVGAHGGDRGVLGRIEAAGLGGLHRPERCHHAISVDSGRENRRRDAGMARRQASDLGDDVGER